MNRLNSTMNSRYDENRTRSANEPVISAGVMIANLSWNIAKITSGTVAHSALFDRLAHAVEHQERHRVADHPAQAIAEGQAEAHHHPDQADHAQRHHALQHRRDHVLQAHHPAVEEREPRRHQQHQRRGRQHPGHVARVDRIARRHPSWAIPWPDNATTARTTSKINGIGVARFMSSPDPFSGTNPARRSSLGPTPNVRSTTAIFYLTV